jgi:hypothetical protein
MLHMLQWLYMYVASVCSKCFTYFGHMLQVFYLDVVICCSGYTHMLQTYVSIVSSSFNMLQQGLLHTPIQRCNAGQLQQSDVHATGGQCPNGRAALVKVPSLVLAN